jgi:hypothetical protein
MLEGRGKSGRHGAIYEIIPVFEYLLEAFEDRVRPFESVDYEQREAPEDHLAINTRAAWAKLREYYTKLDASPAYYAACCLHPYYKRYCEKAWRGKADWLKGSNSSFQSLWAVYKLPRPQPVRLRQLHSGAIHKAIAAVMGESDSDKDEDEYNRWQQLELRWTYTQYLEDSPISYWLGLRFTYPNLSRFAIDILTIPANSCECERMYSELGDLLAPKRILYTFSGSISGLQSSGPITSNQCVTLSCMLLS